MIIDSDKPKIVAAVRRAYEAMAHDSAASVPLSQFLRFPWDRESRAISLPAAIPGIDWFGLKWVSSFPANIRVNRPRASAVYVLNSLDTGQAVAMLEASSINAARTAASASLAASVLSPTPDHPTTVGIIGAGVLARTILDYLFEMSTPPISSLLVNDLDPASASHLVGHARKRGLGATVGTLERVLRCGLIVLATTASTPYLPTSIRFAPGQVVLNVSLRDIAPDTILASQNVVDNAEHCLREQTSVHLAEQVSGSRDFVTAELPDCLAHPGRLNPAKPVIFSPFGLGALDLATAAYVYQTAHRRRLTISIADFHGPDLRWQ